MYVAFIELCFGIGHNLSLICQMTSEDIKHQLIIIILYVYCLSYMQSLFFFCVCFLVCVYILEEKQYTYKKANPEKDGYSELS